MKKLRYLFLALLMPILMISCTDTHEDLVIKGDNSGTLALKTDLSKMLELLKSFGGDSAFRAAGMDRPYDTVMQLKDYVDTATTISAENKAIFRGGKVHIVLDAKQNIGRFDMSFPFKNADQLTKLYAGLGSSTGGLKNMLGNMGNNMGPGQADQGSGNGMPQIASVYDITFSKGNFSRKVNQPRYDQFIQQVKLDELKQMSGVFGAMDYTMTITVPGVIKTVSNAKAVLSADKHTATLKADLLESFQHPELLAVDITY